MLKNLSLGQKRS